VILIYQNQNVVDEQRCFFLSWLKQQLHKNDACNKYLIYNDVCGM